MYLLLHRRVVTVLSETRREIHFGTKFLCYIRNEINKLLLLHRVEIWWSSFCTCFVDILYEHSGNWALASVSYCYEYIYPCVCELKQFFWVFGECHLVRHDPVIAPELLVRPFVTRPTLQRWSFSRTRRQRKCRTIGTATDTTVCLCFKCASCCLFMESSSSSSSHVWMWTTATALELLSLAQIRLY